MDEPTSNEYACTCDHCKARERQVHDLVETVRRLERENAELKAHSGREVAA